MNNSECYYCSCCKSFNSICNYHYCLWLDCWLDFWRQLGEYVFADSRYYWT